MIKLTLLSLIFFHFFTPSLQAQNASKPLLNAIQDYIVKRYKVNGGGTLNFPKFSHVLTDLNGDGINDAIVLTQDPRWCGTGGCIMVIFRGNKKGYTFVSESGLVKTPVRILTEKSQGWRNLMVHAGKTGDVVLRIDGTKYPYNSSEAPKANQYQINSAQTLIGRPN